MLSIPAGIESKGARFQLASRSLALDSSWYRERLLSIAIAIENTCSRFQLESRALLSRTAPDSSYFALGCSRSRVGSRALALDSFLVKSKRSRFQLESRALALDSKWNREHLLSIPIGIEGACSRSPAPSRTGLWFGGELESKRS